MALKSSCDSDNQIYELLVQSSDLAIPSKLPAMYLLPSLLVQHQGLRETCAAFNGASIADYHHPCPLGPNHASRQGTSLAETSLAETLDRLSPEFIYYHTVTPHGMYGWNVFQIFQKRGITTEAEFSYGAEEHPSAEVYQLACSQRLSGFSMIHTFDGVKHALVENGPVFIALTLHNNGPAFWKSDSDQANQAHDFNAVAIEGYDTNGFFRNSWGPDWGNNGCGYLPFLYVGNWMPCGLWCEALVFLFSNLFFAYSYAPLNELPISLSVLPSS